MRPNACEHFQELVSAGIDGELDLQEEPALQDHLRDCTECTRFHVACQRLDQIITDAGEGVSVDRMRVNGVVSAALQLPTPRSPVIESTGAAGESESDAAPVSVAVKATFPVTVASSESWFLRWSVFLCCAVAASILIAIGWSFIGQPRRPAQDDVAMRSILAQYAINAEALQDQQALLRTFEMELRTMRLELDQMKLDESTRARLSRRIDELLHKTSQLFNTPVVYSGEGL